MSTLSSRIENRIDRLSPIQFSGAIHFIVLLIFASLFIERSQKTVIDMTVIDAPMVNPAATKMPDEIAKPIPKKEPPMKAVYGLSRKAITTDAAVGETVKLGNTVAVAPDDKKLKDSDADSLPIPADEFMVSAMPTLKSEVRIPYPPEARKNNIQGPVVMDLLVDSSGKVRQVSLIQGPGYGLNEAAVEAAKGFLFTPARIGDQSVAVRIRYSYRFIIER